MSFHSITSKGISTLDHLHGCRIQDFHLTASLLNAKLALEGVGIQPVGLLARFTSVVVICLFSAVTVTNLVMCVSVPCTYFRVRKHL